MKISFKRRSGATFCVLDIQDDICSLSEYIDKTVFWKKFTKQELIEYDFKLFENES